MLLARSACHVTRQKNRPRPKTALIQEVGVAMVHSTQPKIHGPFHACYGPVTGMKPRGVFVRS